MQKYERRIASEEKAQTTEAPAKEKSKNILNKEIVTSKVKAPAPDNPKESKITLEHKLSNFTNIAPLKNISILIKKDNNLGAVVD